MEANLGEIQAGTVSSVVLVSVHMQDLLALDRKQSGKDTFGQTGAQDNDLWKGRSASRRGDCQVDIHRIPHP